MFLSLINFALSLTAFSIPDPADPLVVSAQSYLDQTLPFLFPDAYGSPDILVFDRQPFALNTVTLSVKMLPDVWFRVVVTVTVEGQAHLERLEGLSSSERPGSYHWQDPATLSEDAVKSLDLLLAEQEHFRGSIVKVLSYRVKVIAGTSQHVIFEDDKGRLCAAVLTNSPEIGERITYFVNPPTY
jgi:hypothetical protein